MKKKYYYLILSFLCGLSSNLFGQNLPQGFSSIAVLEGIENISSFAFIDQDKIILAKQSGEIHLYDTGVYNETPIARIPTIISSVGGDRGIAGIALDPDYPTSPYLYVTYTVEAATHNILSRFIFNGSSIDLDSEEVLVEYSPLVGIWHTGGAIVFDDSGRLFTTTGDNSVPANAQDLNTTHGKVIRIFKDGTIPTDNPYYGGETEFDDIFWGLGLRNPYTMAIHKEFNVIYVNDVGQHAWEEVNNASGINRNFGWSLEEGYNSSPTSTYINPSYAYEHPNGVDTDSTGYAITGAAFYDPIEPKYPTEYINKYFFMDYNGRWINYVDPISNLVEGHQDHIHDLRHTRETFASAIPGGVIYLTLSPDGYLYYVSRFTKKLYKITYYDGDEPIILSSPEDTTTMLGESTLFKVIAGGAPDLNYEWYKNGSLLGSSPNNNVYSWGNTLQAREGDYQVRVFNSFGEVWSPIFTLTVIPFNEAATVDVAVSSPINGNFYQAGETIDFSAISADPEVGTIPSANYKWFLEFHHDTHIHDGPAFATAIDSGTFTIPDVGETSSNVFYRFIARVTDDIGQVSEGFADILPLTSDITFETDPVGLEVSIDGPSVPTPFTSNFVQHLKLPVDATTQTIDGVDAIYRLSHWSETVIDDLYTVPDLNTTITAHFQECTIPEDIPSLTFQEIRVGALFSWDTIDPVCNQGFILENMNSSEQYNIFGERDALNYNYIVLNLDDGVEYQFRVWAYNEYGISDYTYLTFTLGVEDIGELNDILLFPNPTQDFITIDGINSAEEYDIHMYSILGQSVNYLLSTDIKESQIRLDISNLSNGVYFLNMSIDKKRKTFKILKN